MSTEQTTVMAIKADYTVEVKGGYTPQSVTLYFLFAGFKQVKKKIIRLSYFKTKAVIIFVRVQNAK